MSDLLRALGAYVPYALIRRALEDPAVPGEPRAERFPAAVLFADVSGFTPLTEALARRGAEGPEELTRLLNRYFGRIISLIEAEGGEVVKFGGDAVTVVFPAGEAAEGEDCHAAPLGHAARRALQAAEAMQSAMEEFSTLETSVGSVKLEMKIGVGVGEVLAMQIGGVRGHWEYVIAGEPLRQVTEAEGRARRGEIVLSPEAAAAIHPRPLPPCPLELPDWSLAGDPDLLAANLRGYVPAPVLAWMDEGLSDWLAVLRPMSVLFVGVQGLDYDRAEVVEQLHAFLAQAMQIIDRYQGVISRVAVDDKGTILLVLFGAPPLSHEDDPVRAVRCALDLQRAVRSSALDLAIGVTTGHVFAGPVGSATRREYTVMGDAANLAARLMVRAKAGTNDVICDEYTYQQARQQIEFESLGPVRAKGKRGVVVIYRPLAEIVSRRAEILSRYPLVGRKGELARLEAALDAVAAGETRVLVVQGEAGMGKSRLVGELRQLVQQRGLTSLFGAGQSIEQQTPYRVWRDIMAAFFELEEIADPQERQMQVQRMVQRVAPEQVGRLPLLNDLLNMSFPETELTAALDPALRQQSLTALLLTLLRARAREHPLVLVLEDAQWLDSLSWELAVYGARALATSGDPLLLVLVCRPMEKKSIGAEHLETLELLVDVETVALAPLEPREIVAMIEARFDLPQGTLPRPVAGLLRQRSQGNPFFAEELALSLRDQKVIRFEVDPARRDHPEGRFSRCLIQGDLERARQTLPDTVQGLVLGRIGRLSPERQLALRVASVIGSPFAYSPLCYTMQQHTSVIEDTLKSHLDSLAALDLTPLYSSEPELAYAFKNIVTRDVAYETLLFAQRRALHRTVARWYERTFRSQMAVFRSYYPLLVHHYHYAGDGEREQNYAKLAGEQAASQFANAEAVTYLNRALELTPERDAAERYAFLLARERVYDVMGDREAQRQDLQFLQAMIEAEEQSSGPLAGWEGLVVAIRKAELSLRQARFSETTGEYPAAVAAARAAIDLAQRVAQQAAQDAANAPLGLKAIRLQAAGYLQWGRALWRRGHYEIAQVWLERGLEVARVARERRIEADSLRTLGVVGWRLGEYAQARAHLEQALQFFQEIGDRRGESAVLNDLGLVSQEQGDVEQSRRYYGQSLRIRQEIGDRAGEGASLYSLGVVDYNQGFYRQAQAHFEQSLHIYREIAGRRGEGAALHMLGSVARQQGDYALADQYYEQALNTLRAIGEPRTEALVLASAGLLKHLLGNDRTARTFSEQALWIGQDLADRYVQGYALTVLGHALAGRGVLGEATAAYEKALDLQQALREHHLAVESRAGLARVALAGGDLDQAVVQVEAILSHLEQGSLAGADEPLRVYLTCYEVLQAAQDPRAWNLLLEAYRLLRERSDQIRDAGPGHSLWEQVAVYRKVLRERDKVVRRFARLVRGSARQLEAVLSG